MNKASKHKVAKALKGLLTSYKVASQVRKEEFGEERKKQASQAVDSLVESGLLQEDKKQAAVKHLLFNKKSNLNTLQALANELTKVRSEVNAVGTPSGRKEASSSGYKSKADEWLDKRYSKPSFN